MFDANRRDFLKQAGVGVAGALALSLPMASARAAGANERVVTALIGCGGRGGSLLDNFDADDGCDMAYVCDPDSSRGHLAAESLTKRGQKAPQVVSDLRRVLEDKAVDAVIIATPDHWHATAAILACNAGKHVYVEKPCSHNLREGRLLVEAARRNNVVVQHGTQSRSSQLIADAVRMLREGVIGDVLVAKAWNIQVRDNIGHAKPSNPPEGFDYDMWVGPAAFLPYQENRVHYKWHWWYNFGTGDTGNDGAHELDYARWGLGVETHPSRISGLGGKFFFDDDQQFPDTQQVAFEYPGDGTAGKKRMLIWEMRLWSSNYPYNVDSGAEFYGTKGRMLLSKRGKVEIFGERNKRIEGMVPHSPSQLLGHNLDFLDAIRNDRKPNADIEIGHLSASLCHLANISTRVGRTLQFDAESEQMIGDEEANKLLTREYREGGHWAVPANIG